MLLVEEGSTVRLDKVSVQEAYEDAPNDETDLDKKIVYEDLISLIKTSSVVGKVVFHLFQNAKSLEFPEGHCKSAWDKIVNIYEPHTALFLLKLKSGFHNSKLNSIE